MRDFRFGALFCSQGVFALAFFYALSVGLLIQLVMLPFVTPALDAGHGLLKGGDWVWFHQEAVQLANRIHHEGWVVWELRPQGNAPIGIAAAAYALTGISEPWVLMPLNASLFAVGATCLYMMFALIASHQLAFAATMPYVIFPSAAVIFGQIHKDVWSIAGFALVALVWARFAAYSMLGWKDAGIQVMFALTGVLLILLVRPYLVQIVLAASILAVFVIIQPAFTRTKRSVQWWAGVFLSLALLVFFVKSPSGTEVSETVKPAAWEPTAGEPAGWTRTELIPVSVDNVLSIVAGIRRGFSEGYPHAGSNIDTEVKFRSAADVASYMPRALQIALFSPFPDMWRGSGFSPGADHMRLVSGIEMAFTYLLLPGVVFLFMCRGLHGPTTLVFIQAIVPAIILAMVVSNIGTLYRMRFVNMQMLNGLGMIGWVMWLQHWHAKYRSIQN